MNGAVFMATRNPKYLWCWLRNKQVQQLYTLRFNHSLESGRPVELVDGSRPAAPTPLYKCSLRPDALLALQISLWALAANHPYVRHSREACIAYADTII